MCAVGVELELIEREAELAVLRDLAVRAREGAGSAVIVEAPAGQGKTALLRAFRGVAADAGVRLLWASGSQLERDYPFGIAQQLFAPAVRADDGQLFAGAAQHARPALDPVTMADEATDVSFARLHGLYWLASNLADEQPLAVVVDDAHWADTPSLRFLDVLTRRVQDLPLTVVVGVRPAEPDAEEELLDSIAGSSAVVLRPRSLSGAGVADLLERTLHTVPEEPFVDAAVETTAGNPLLVRELLRTASEQGLNGRADEVEALQRALPGNLSRQVVARLRRLAPASLAVARAVAVLCDRKSRLADVAEVAGVTAAEASAEHRTLAQVGLLDPEQLRYTHPVVCDAVLADFAPGERADWHRRAADVGRRTGSDPAELAAHLVVAEPVGERWAGDALVAAGRRALTDGAPEAAVRYLARALAEPLGDRQAALLTLGRAEARTGDVRAAAHLEAAASGSDPALAAEAVQDHAQVLVLQERAGEAAAVLRSALERASDPVLAAELENGLVDVLAHHVPLRAEYLRRLEAAAGDDRPTLLAHLAFVRAMSGAAAPEVLDLARRALRSPTAGGGPFTHFYALEALMTIEAAAEAASALREATALAHRLGSRVVAGPLTYMPSAWSAWERAFGDLRRAEELARETTGLMVAAGAPALVVGLRGALAAVLVDRGRIEEADHELSLLPAREAGPGLRETHGMRARLRYEQGRYDDALAEVRAELELENERAWVTSNREPTRLTQVRILLALGRGDAARDAALAELATASGRGIAGVEARARLGHALTLDGAEAVEAMRAAAEAAARSPNRRLRADVLLELGGLLRRRGERVAAREPLAEARELAHQCGATGLETRAHEELIIAGARPRRVAQSGLDALTAAERRVAELAADGLRNREIAETLFVTQKTVEVHLGHVYGKLAIKGRSQLAAALASG